MTVKALTPSIDIESYYEASSVFMGNINEMVLEEELADGKYKSLLVTLTDNGGGGQPVSMANIKHVTSKAREKGMLIWFDACRIHENALFIKAFEPGF